MYLGAFDLSDFYPVIATALTALLAIGMKWVSAQAWASQGVRDFGVYIEGFGNRAKDKFLAETIASKTPDSDGGVTITHAEYSKIRQDMYDLLMSEIKGPAKDYAIKLGANVIKGLIGKYLKIDV